MADIGNPPGFDKNTPSRDIFCPITSNIFDDTVVLETGQTCEHKAIQKWNNKGSSTCPMSRQSLHKTQLPKTNYMVKHLIPNCREQNPGDTKLSETVSNSTMRLSSPNSVITQATIDGMVSDLQLAITNLCDSEILKESEMAILQIERFWQDVNMETEIQSMITRPHVINNFVEILFNSVDSRVLRASVFLLSELGSRDNSVINMLKQVDSDLECIITLFKKGLYEAVVLIYLLRLSNTRLVKMGMVDALLSVIKKEDGLGKMCMNLKTCSVILLGQILGSTEADSLSDISTCVISTKMIENIVASLEAEWAEERIAAVNILLKCIQEDGMCRKRIADKAELAPVLDTFIGANDHERFEIVNFLSELVKLNRRTLNEKVLHIIKDEGSFSTMHTLLIYLQKAPQDQCPIVAGLILQLDLLADPKKASIYREEAIDTLVSCLRNSDFPAAQVAAANTILSLQGRFSSHGKPLARSFLLKSAGLDNSYKSVMRMEQLHNMPGDIHEEMEEEKAVDEWEKKVAFVLVNYEFGLIFEALAEGLTSRYADLSSLCFMSATWLVHTLLVLPDTGLQGAARVCLLKHFVSIFKSAKEIEDRALAMLALSNFIRDPEGQHDLTSSLKDIFKGLRELKKTSVVASEMLKVISERNESSADLWNHKEAFQQDCSINGEVLSIICSKGMIFSGHSDGTIKVWTCKGNIVQLVQETCEHSKAVTSLAILESGEKLYSGSLDRTVRVWSIDNEVIHCEQVYDVKDHVNNFVVANSIFYFIPQGSGVKVHSWNGASKLLSANKHVKCLALAEGKLYCGGEDNSIQEIDLATSILSTIQSGNKKFLGKVYPIQALQVHDGRIYSVSSSLDGVALKIWDASNYSMVGSLASSLEVRAMAISSELIYLGGKTGIVEVWCRHKLSCKETLQSGSHAKIVCMALDSDEQLLLVGTSDGKIQAWEVSLRMMMQVYENTKLKTLVDILFSPNKLLPLEAAY